MVRHFYLYILASGKHETLYIGVTNDLVRRVYEHKEKVVPGFTHDHGIDKLVCYEIFDDPESAIVREKRLNRWKRNWKVELIERDNPDWDDLYSELT